MCITVNLAKLIGLGLDPHELGQNNPQGKSPIQLKKSTRPKSSQKTCGLGSAHGLSY